MLRIIRIKGNYAPSRPLKVGLIGAFGTICTSAILALNRRADKASFNKVSHAASGGELLVKRK